MRKDMKIVHLTEVKYGRSFGIGIPIYLIFSFGKYFSWYYLVIVLNTRACARFLTHSIECRNSVLLLNICFATLFHPCSSSFARIFSLWVCVMCILLFVVGKSLEFLVTMATNYRTSKTKQSTYTEIELHTMVVNIAIHRIPTWVTIIYLYTLHLYVFGLWFFSSCVSVIPYFSLYLSLPLSGSNKNSISWFNY